MNKETLKKISKALDKSKATWAIGGSVLLNKYNLVDKPKDIDILIDAKDSEKVKQVMHEIGEYMELPSKEPFMTKEFFGYRVDDVVVEFLGDFEIDLGNNKSYRFILDDKSITRDIIKEDVSVNLSTLEDWYVAYSVMGDPKKRTQLIRNYFKVKGINHKNLLERNLTQELPENIKNDIKSIRF